MATIYVSPAGGGNGSSSGSPTTLSSAAGSAQAGDTVILLDGSYSGGFPQPTNNGTSSAPIVFQAQNTNGPVFDAGTLVTGWALANGTGALGYSDSGSNIYRATYAGDHVSTMVWVNDFINTVSGHAPTGRNCALANMGFNYGNSFNNSSLNPNTRITAFGSSAQLSSYGLPLQQDTFQFRQNSDGAWGPSNSLDIRLNNDNPSGYTIYATTSGSFCFNWSSKAYITVKGVQVLRWKTWVGLTSCTGVVFDTCSMRYSSRAGAWWVGGCNACKFVNCTMVGTGSVLTGNDDMITFGDRATNCVIDGNTLLYCGHDVILVYAGGSSPVISGGVIRNNEIGFTDAGLNLTEPGSSIPTGFTIENNYFHDCGRSTFQGYDAAGDRLHSGIECSSLNNSVIRRNRFLRCGYGFYFSCQGAKEVGNNKIYHNTFADCERNCVRLLSDAYQGGTNEMVHDNIFVDNIFHGPNGGTTAAHDAAVYVNIWAQSSGGTVDPAWAGNPWWGNRFDHNLFYAPGGGVVVKTNVGTWTSISSAVGGSYDGASNSVLLTNNLTADPLFTNLGGSDLTLGGSSPAINAGVAVSYSGIQADTGSYISAPDIGYWESGGAVSHTAPTCAIQASVTTGTAPLSVSFASTYQLGDGTSITTWAWSFPGGSITSSAVQNPGTVTFNAAGSYACTLRVTDNNGTQSTLQTQTITVSGSGGGNGTTLLNPLPAAGAYASSVDTGTTGADDLGPPYAAARAFDADTASQWIKDPAVAMSAAAPATLTYDLTGAIGVFMDADQVRFMFRNYATRGYSYDLWTSQADGSSGPPAPSDAAWTQQLALQNSTVGTQSMVHTWATPFRCRWIQLRIYSNTNGTPYAGVADFLIFAKAVSGGGGGGGGGGTTGNTKDRANSYDAAWQTAWVAHSLAVYRTANKTTGCTLLLGDSISFFPYNTYWPRSGQGHTTEDQTIINWTGEQTWPAGEPPALDTTSRNGWYLARRSLSGSRSFTAASSIDTISFLSGTGCDAAPGSPAMPTIATSSPATAMSTLIDGTYTANLNFQTVVSAFPDAQFALLMIGTNDVRLGNATGTYSTNLAQMVTILETQNIVVILSTLPPYANHDVTPYNAIILSLAQSRGLPLIDFYAEVLARRPGTTWQNTLIDYNPPTTSGIHPSNTGGGYDSYSNPYSPGGDPATHTTGDPATWVGFLLRSWLTVQKLKQVKLLVADAAAGGGGGGGGGGTGLPVTSYTTDPPQPAAGLFTVTRLLANSDPSRLDPLSRWFHDGNLPQGVVCDLGAGNHTVGRLRLFPYKSNQGQTFHLTISGQPDVSSTWTDIPGMVNVATVAGAVYTDFSFTPQSIRKLRIMFLSASPAPQIGAWKCAWFSS